MPGAHVKFIDYSFWKMRLAGLDTSNFEWTAVEEFEHPFCPTM